MTEITRMGVIYRQHVNGTITCGELNQSGMVGGTGEETRNRVHNPERIQRIRHLHPHPKVLDFGCGSGLLVEDLLTNGIEAIGYDKYATDVHSESAFVEMMAVRPLKDHIFHDEFILQPAAYDVVTMIEVVEHTSWPYSELDQVLACLKPGGVVMIETSFTDWMELSTDTYINPSIGHSTIFSHKGLDEVMIAKGFEIYGHANRNVRLYQRPEVATDTKITLVTMGQSNPVALKRTMDSFKDTVDEFVFGDLLIFESDRKLIESYQKDYNLKVLPLEFNFIFKNGFASTLNTLAAFTSNDWILYMNVSEVMDGRHAIKAQMSNLYNCYSFDHAVDPHTWFRLYKRNELKWGGLIHEEVIGAARPCPFHVFRMMDTEKDMDDSFKAKVSNDIKELCYFQQYLRLVENPELQATTHKGWIDYATDSYDNLKERLLKKGKRYQAFVEGNLEMYLEDIYTNPEFAEERFQSSDLINFQGDRKLL